MATPDGWLKLAAVPVPLAKAVPLPASVVTTPLIAATPPLPNPYELPTLERKGIISIN